MRTEHWGTLSVKDHLDLQAVVADLLLYDRLVFPVMSGDGERARWRAEGWDPDWQEVLVERLGDRFTVKAPWDADRQQRWKDLRNLRGQISVEAFQTTRMVLAMDQRYAIPDGVRVRAVAAYHDTEEATIDLGLETRQPDPSALGKLAYVVGRELLVPEISPGDRKLDILSRATDLASKTSFQSERAEFYEWLEHSVDQIAAGRSSVEQAVGELKKRSDALNKPVYEHFTNHWKGLAVKSALIVVGFALPHAIGLPEASGAIGLLPHAYDLMTFGTEQVVDALAEQKPEAAAMIVSAGALRRRPARFALRPPWRR